MSFKLLHARFGRFERIRDFGDALALIAGDIQVFGRGHRVALPRYDAGPIRRTRFEGDGIAVPDWHDDLSQVRHEVVHRDVCAFVAAVH